MKFALCRRRYQQRKVTSTLGAWWTYRPRSRLSGRRKGAGSNNSDRYQLHKLVEDRHFENINFTLIKTNFIFFVVSGYLAQNPAKLTELSKLKIETKLANFVSSVGMDLKTCLLQYLRPQSTAKNTPPPPQQLHCGKFDMHTISQWLFVRWVQWI